MSGLRAFVGHSFEDEDTALIRIFLDYFNQIKEMGIGFTWDHAKAAEPTELAQKVLRLVEGKNLFIGICTRKERAIEAAVLKRGSLRREILRSREDNYSWKTSDWIIQEIGLAIGRDMKLILLVEGGLRKPGGLQGNLEYIEFNRQFPERSFGKVLEMIRAILPHGASAPPPQETELQRDKNLPEESEKTEEGPRLEPKPDWKRGNYEFAFFRCVTTGDEVAERAITKAYFESPEGAQERNRESWEAFGEYLKLVFAKGGKISVLEELVASHPQNGEIQWYLALAYEEYKEHDKAAAAFRRSAEHTGDMKQKMEKLGKAALSLLRAGSKVEVHGVVTEIRQAMARSGDGHQRVVEILRDMAIEEADNELYFGLTECMLELRPDDTNIRFDLAYKYSQKNQQELSLFHYLRIPERERGGGSWNNLGVQYDHFEISSRSINAYRKAEELGETLAMSNLAQKLVQAGFLREAEEICSRALKMENYHKNIGYAITRIKEVPEEEEKKEKELTQKGLRYSEFYREFGKGAVASEPSDQVGVWEDPKCKLHLEIKGSIFRAEGSYELATPTLAEIASMRLGVWGSGGSSTPSKYVVKYVGELSGRAVKAVITEQREDQPETILGGLVSSPQAKKVLMVFAESLDKILVYEKDALEEKRFYSLRRIS